MKNLMDLNGREIFLYLPNLFNVITILTVDREGGSGAPQYLSNLSKVSMNSFSRSL